MIKTFDVNLNPYLNVHTDGKNRSLSLFLEAKNEHSLSRISLQVRNTGLNSSLNRVIVLVIFL
jgi:hypothetical protein